MIVRLSSTVMVLVLALVLGGCITVGRPSVGTPAPLRTLLPSGPLPSMASSATAMATAPPVPSASTAVASSGAIGPSSGSIVFVKDANVWIAAPDGSAARQLTTDGDLAGYHDPSQAPDGTIFALRGSSSLVVLNRSTGAVTLAPVTLPTLENGAEGLTVAPDGTHMAYTTTGYGQEIDPRFGTPTGIFIYGGTDIATVDGQSVPNAASPSMIFPTWLDASALVMTDGVKLYTAPIGAAELQLLLDESDGCILETDCPPDQGSAADISQPSVSRDGRLLAYTYKPYYGDPGRVVARMNAGAQQPPTNICNLVGQQDYSDPGSFAPDGTAFTYDDTNFDPNTFESTIGEGIYVLDLDLSAPDCGSPGASLAIPGGAQPDWGPLAP